MPVTPRPVISTLTRSGIREIMDLAGGDPGVIRLEVGEPDFPTPHHVVEAAVEAARGGFTNYTPSRGIPELREAAASKLAGVNGIHCSADEVLITAGAINGILVALAALLAPGDAVLVPDPGWPNYRNMARILGLEVIAYRLAPDGGFQPDPEEITGLIAAHRNVGAMIVNSPSNPTGAVFTASTIGEILEVCRRHDVTLISDECYDQIVFDREHVSPASRVDGEECVSVYSLSKTYAMTGWRVGYVTAARPLIDALAKVQETWNSCVNSLAQKAAEAALRGPQDVVHEMVADYRRRRDAALDELAAHDLQAWRPDGAFYLMVDIPDSEDIRAFARRLVTSHGTAVAPGSTFGAVSERMVRLSLASPIGAITEGIRRLAMAAQTEG